MTKGLAVSIVGIKLLALITNKFIIEFYKVRE